MGIHRAHDSAYARTKNNARGWRLASRDRPVVVGPPGSLSVCFLSVCFVSMSDPPVVMPEDGLPRFSPAGVLRSLGTGQRRGIHPWFRKRVDKRLASVGNR